ncbi:MAG: hypothetical protein WCL29_07715, partial [Pseudomonadota bacterium]
DKDIFDHAPASRGAKDYQALYDELTSCAFMGDDDETEKSNSSMPLQALIAGTSRPVSVFA